MKKLMMTTLAVAVLAAATTANVNAGALLERVHATKKLTVATAADWGNSSFVNDKNELDGFEIDVAQGIAKHLGVHVKFLTPGWDLIVSGDWADRWDLAMGQMTPTKARAETFDFSAVYVYTRAVAVVHKDSKATKLSDLEEKVVGVPTADTVEAYANHSLTLDWIGAKPVEYKFTPGSVRTYASTALTLDDLRIGDGVRLDAVLTDQSTALDAIKAGYPLKILGEPLFAAPGAIAILKGDKEFSDKILAAIQSMRDDGSLSKLSVKWYGVDNTVE